MKIDRLFLVNPKPDHCSDRQTELDGPSSPA